MRTDPKQPVRLADYRVPDHLIERVDLDVRLAGNATRVVNRLAILPNPAGVPGAPLALDGDGLLVRRIEIDGAPLPGWPDIAKSDGLVIAEPPQRPFTLTVETELDPAANSQLMGLYRSGSAYCTQCEAEGFRRITYFLDRPDVLSVYTTRIEAERAEAPVLLSNGNKIAEGEVKGTSRHFAVWHDPHPKPCYLFALVGGDLGAVRDVFFTGSGRKVDLAIYVEHGKEPRAAYALDALKRAMAWDEKTFGREYDLDVFNIVAVSDFNMGAMENKGLNIFNDKYVLALPETATDVDYASIEAVIGHEYFHNWTGDRITCRDWFQLCLKEGLTVFRDQEFSSDQRSRAVKRIADVRMLRAAQFPEDAGPLAHPVRPQTYMEINNFYTPTVYEKGAEVIRMLKVLIGAEAFRAGMDLYFSRFDGTAATIEDFVSCFAEASGRDLTQFMRWYDQAGTPKLSVVSHYDAVAQTLTLDFAQSTPPTPGQAAKEPQVVPIALGLVAPGGGDIALKTHGPNEADGADPEELRRGVFELSGAQRKITFLGLPAAPVPSLLRGFSAPVRLDFDLGEDDLLTLLHDDSDTFNRWQAAQTYATRLLIRSVAAIRAGGGPIEEPGFLAAIAGLLAGHAADPAFTAQAVSLPSEADIAREIGENVDPDAIFAAREALRRQIGRSLARQWRELYETNAAQQAYAPDAASAGRRACRNIALAFLAAGDEQEGSQRATAQLRTANNMTDEIAALGVLTRIRGEMREQALQAFLRSHASDTLVIDKWFALQATIPETETLARVRALMAHHAFSMSNPNRMRALVGSFAAMNPTRFNAADGSGYAFVAENVIALDPKNPQVAARLLGAFRSWRTLEPGRRARAETVLRQVAAVTPLSPDVRDIVERSLA